MKYIDFYVVVVFGILARTFLTQFQDAVYTQQQGYCQVGHHLFVSFPPNELGLDLHPAFLLAVKVVLIQGRHQDFNPTKAKIQNLNRS